jgi:hypothetical protein
MVEAAALETAQSVADQIAAKVRAASAA